MDSYLNFLAVANLRKLFLFALLTCIFLVPISSSAFYEINSVGGECSQIGEWDSTTNTCTLTRTVNEDIRITSSLVTLDGNGHTVDVTAEGADYAVEVDDVFGVEVRNLNLIGGGVSFDNADNTSVRFNTINDAPVGINFFNLNTGLAEGNEFISTPSQPIIDAITAQDVSNLTLRNNQIAEVDKAIRLVRVDVGTVEANNISSVGTGLELDYFSDGEVTNNVFENVSVGVVLNTDGSDTNSFTSNTFSDSELAVEINASGGGGPGPDPVPTLTQLDWWKLFLSLAKSLAAKTVFAQVASGNVFSQNNFLNNGEDVEVSGAADVTFSDSLPDGGNYWDKYDEAGEGCDDGGSDGFCDAEYIVSSAGYEDEYPRTSPVNVIMPDPQCSDGDDNDGDGLTDFPDDLGCDSADDALEINPPAPTCTLEVTPATIEVGSTATLVWTSVDANSAELDNGVGTVALSGSTTVSPDITTTYTATFAGSDRSVECETEVVVTASGLPTLDLEAVGAGQFKPTGRTSLPTGSIFIGNEVVIRGLVDQPDGGLLTMEVEIKGVGESFNGSDIQVSGQVAAGDIAEVLVSDLIPKSEHYVQGGNKQAFQWRARAVGAGGEVSDWQEFAPGDSADFIAKVVPLFTQVRSDFPSRAPQDEWADQEYAAGRSNVSGDCGLSIAECGCAIASIAMLAHAEDIRTDAVGADIDPFNLDAWLLANGGYTPDGSVLWSSIDRYTDNQLVFAELFNSPGSSNPNNQPSAGEFAKLDNALEQTEPMPVIARSWWQRPRGGIARTHFFVIDSKLSVDEYSVRDPFWFQTKTLSEDTSIPRLVRRYEGGFEGLRVYKRGSGSLAYTPSISTVLSSPAELLLTDAQGQRLGKDPRTGEVFAEIPDGYYYEELINNPNPEVPDPVSPDPEKILVVPNLPDGRYRLEVIGTGNGPYTLQTTFIDTKGKSKQITKTGTTSVNEVTEYRGEFLGDAANGSSVELPPGAQTLFSELVTVAQSLKTKPRLLSIRIKLHVVLAKRLYERGKVKPVIKILNNLKRLVKRRTNNGLAKAEAAQLLELIEALQTILKARS